MIWKCDMIVWWFQLDYIIYYLIILYYLIYQKNKSKKRTDYLLLLLFYNLFNVDIAFDVLTKSNVRIII